VEQGNNSQRREKPKKHPCDDQGNTKITTDPRAEENFACSVRDSRNKNWEAKARPLQEKLMDNHG
jgi:hypothetical protein